MKYQTGQFTFRTTRFDCFPVELSHCLLSSLSAHEIFYAFTNINSYIDAVLAGYDNYRVNLQSISSIDAVR